MNITLTITLAPEVLEILKGITKGLGAGASASLEPTVKEPKKVKTKKSLEVAPPDEDDADPIDEAPEPDEDEDADTIDEAPEPDEDDDEAEMSVETFRKKVNALAQAGKKENIKALLKKLGASSVSSVPAEKYSLFLKKLAS